MLQTPPEKKQVTNFMQRNLGAVENLGTLSFVPSQRQINSLNITNQVNQYASARQMFQFGTRDIAGLQSMYSKTLG